MGIYGFGSCYVILVGISVAYMMGGEIEWTPYVLKIRLEFNEYEASDNNYLFFRHLGYRIFACSDLNSQSVDR